MKLGCPDHPDFEAGLVTSLDEGDLPRRSDGDVQSNLPLLPRKCQRFYFATAARAAVLALTC